MSEPSYVSPDFLQQLRDAIDAAAENNAESTITIAYVAEGVDSKVLPAGNVSLLEQERIVYLDAESEEVQDYWNAVAYIKITEPSDVPEIDV
jgi:hypothetical protein